MTSSPAARLYSLMMLLNAIDEDSLSVADAAYYAEVTGRVAQKLQSVSY